MTKIQKTNIQSGTGVLIEINEMNADKLYHLFSTYLSGLPRSVVLSSGEVS